MSHEVLPYTLSDTEEHRERAYSMSVEEFQALKVAERDAILFALIREMAGSVQFLTLKIEEYEAKFREMGSPEGMQALSGKVMDMLGGGLFKGGW